MNGVVDEAVQGLPAGPRQPVDGGLGLALEPDDVLLDGGEGAARDDQVAQGVDAVLAAEQAVQQGASRVVGELVGAGDQQGALPLAQVVSLRHYADNYEVNERERHKQRAQAWVQGKSRIV